LVTQVHDWNPGVSATGVFWTTPIEKRNVVVNAETGAATMSVFNLPMPDYGDLVTALTTGESVQGTVNVVCQWDAGEEMMETSSDEYNFAGNYFHNVATLSWSAENEDGTRFVADPMSVGFAEVGTTRNGQFME
jgi:hypothetical protein